MQKLLIIGGGFSAVALACQLLKQQVPQHIRIVAPKHTWFGGTAYRCAARNHRLNVVAGNMSLYPQHPNDFIDFLVTQSAFSNTPRQILAKQFIERRWYGAYLRERMTQAQNHGQLLGHFVEWVDAQVDDIETHAECVRLTLQNNVQLEAERLVVATGNKPSSPPWQHCLANGEQVQHSALVSNPWLAEFPVPIDEVRPVVLIGAGLTMVDTYFALRKQGISNPVMAVSRKGLQPLPHSFATLADIGVNPHYYAVKFLQAKSLKQQLALAACTLRDLAAAGKSPEAFAAAIREHTQSIWRQWSMHEKNQFMRHLVSYWNVIRHRVPLDIYDSLQHDQQLGLLSYQQGRIERVSGQSRFPELHLSHRNGSCSQIESALIINCTGPSRNAVTSASDPLFTEVTKGRYQRDALGFGVAVDPESFAVLEATGEPSKVIFVMGSLLRGALWETTAVPDIRVLSHKLADLLVTNAN